MKKLFIFYIFCFLGLYLKAENNQGKSVFNQLKPLLLRVKAADSLSLWEQLGAPNTSHKHGLYTIPLARSLQAIARLKFSQRYFLDT